MSVTAYRYIIIVISFEILFHTPTAYHARSCFRSTTIVSKMTPQSTARKSNKRERNYPTAAGGNIIEILVKLDTGETLNLTRNKSVKNREYLDKSGRHVYVKPRNS